MKKRTTKRTMTMLATTTLVLVMASAASAQGPGARAGQQGPQRGLGGPGQDQQRLIEFLELDETQAEQWRAAHERSREQMQPLFEEMGRLRQELREALESDAADPTFVGELVLEQHDLRGQLKAQREALEAELAQILTQEQRDRWEAFKEARRERRPHRGPGGPGPGGSGPGLLGG
jgi:Spy/CpxP family protein refolding chaperone